MAITTLPKLWTLVTLGDVCEIERGVTFPSDAQTIQPLEGNIACLRTSNVQEQVDWGNLIYIPRSYIQNEKKLVRNNDILISIANSKELVGKVSFVDEVKVEAAFGGFISVIRATDFIDPTYLYCFLRAKNTQEKLRSVSNQTTNIANLTIKEIAQLTIPLPPLSEQRRIADILRRADMLRQWRRDANEKARELEKALFYEMFGNPDPKRNDRGWNAVKIGKVLDVGTGSTPSRAVKEYYGGSHNWVKTTELKDDIILSTEETLTEKGLANSNAKIYPVNTVLVAMYGQGQTRGRTAKLGVPASVNQACGAFLPSDELLPDYLWHWFQNSYERMRNMSRGGPQENLNLQILKDLYIPKPPRDIQLKFVAAIEQHRSIGASISEVTAKFNDLILSITARAFTGELTAFWREKHKEELQRAAVERDQKLGLRGEIPTMRDAVEGRLTPEEEEHLRQALGQFSVNTTKMLESMRQSMLEMVSPLADMNKNLFEPLLQSIRQSLQTIASVQLPLIPPISRESVLNYIDNLPVPQEKRSVIGTLDTTTLRVLKLAGTYPAYFTANDLEAGEFGGITTLQAEASLRTLQALGFVKLVQMDGLLRYRLTDEHDYADLPSSLSVQS